MESFTGCVWIFFFNPQREGYGAAEALFDPNGKEKGYVYSCSQGTQRERKTLSGSAVSQEAEDQMKGDEQNSEFHRRDAKDAEQKTTVVCPLRPRGRS